MPRVTTIEELALLIAREFKPERILLFGSQAHGSPTPDSAGKQAVHFSEV